MLQKKNKLLTCPCCCCCCCWPQGISSALERFAGQVRDIATALPNQPAVPAITQRLSTRTEEVKNGTYGVWGGGRLGVEASELAHMHMVPCRWSLTCARTVSCRDQQAVSHEGMIMLISACVNFTPAPASSTHVIKCARGDCCCCCCCCPRRPHRVE
jgi:hypothetical protein